MCFVFPCILNLSFMYTVKFCSSVFAEVKSDVEAVQLALALHQSSNLSHIVSVLNQDGYEIVSLNLSK